MDFVIAEGPSGFELHSGEDEALLFGRDPLFVLDFGLYIVDGIVGLYVESDCFARQGLYESAV